MARPLSQPVRRVLSGDRVFGSCKSLLNSSPFNGKVLTFNALCDHITNYKRIDLIVLVLLIAG
jgi:hypothetical protein